MTRATCPNLCMNTPPLDNKNGHTFESTPDADNKPVEPSIQQSTNVLITPAKTVNKKATPKKEMATESPRTTWSQKQTQPYVPSLTGKSYQYAATQLELTPHEPKVVKLILTQLTLKVAIKTWGNDATIAAKSEMKRLHWRNSFRPVYWNELTDKQKETVLCWNRTFS